MPGDPSNNRVFISCVSDEFEKSDAPFPGFRSQLKHYLTRADCEVKVQEDFRQAGDVDIVEKLAGYIRTCAAVIHLVGEMPGAVANKKAVADYLAGEPKFLEQHPELRAKLGDFSGLTYTQWEAFIALHHDVPMFVYATDKAATAQQEHFKRLRLARKYPGDKRITCPADLLGQLIGDLRTIIPAFGKAVQRLATPRFLHHSAEDFLGREDELARLDRAWADGTNVLSIIAWGGVGKTALLSKWIQTRFIDTHWLDADGQPALLAYFDWSFYDQGTRALTDDKAKRTGSVGDFFELALAHFGDPDVTKPGKGARLAGLVRQQRTLFVLDGLEPLQYPVGAEGMAGRLLDPDLRDFLTALALANPGLCIVTSRQALTDLDGVHLTCKEDLDDLPKPVAVRLLRNMQIAGTDKELEDACEKFGCHALSLTLLGRFLFDAHGGDINRIDRVNLHRADKLTREERHRTAWRVLEAYEEWLAAAKADGNPSTLAVLRLTGLFDRTATPDCLAALRAEPIIAGLTDAIVAMKDDEWNILLKRLERAHLLKLRTDGDQLGIDAHPLVREYFAEQLRTRLPEAFRAAHSRLFDHLCKTTPHRPDDLPGLAPLYQAVVHGCLAGRQQEAKDKVYVDRILRGTGNDGFYSSTKLGAMGADLGAVAAFFEEPWSKLAPNLTALDRAWLLNAAAFRLRALGRLTEAVEPMQVTLGINENAKHWRNASVVAGNLSELEVTLGRLKEAVADARRAVEFADRSEDAFQKLVKRTTGADALHQVGEPAEAETLFAEAERMQAKRQAEFPVLYSLRGFQYVDLLLAPAERAAWLALLRGTSFQLATGEPQDPAPHASATACAEAERRAGEVFRWRQGPIWNPAADSLLDIALDHLTLARARLYRALLSAGPKSEILILESEIPTSRARLRQANRLDVLPQALLTSALYTGTLANQPNEARRYLDEAQQIAERGPMPLYLADVHLHRARLFRDKAELEKARVLIEKHGYGRRKEELADADAAAKAW